MIGSATFWSRALGGLTVAALRRPRRTLALALAVGALAALLAGQRLELRTSNLDLVDPRLPEVARFRTFAAAFGTPNLLVVVLEGDDPALLGAAVGRVASAVTARPGVRSVLARLPFRDEALIPLGLDPYFRSRDGRLAFVFVQPDDPDSAAATIAPFVEGVREAVAGVDLESGGIRAGFTGLPQYALDDRDVVQGDIARLSAISLALVALLFAVGFRGWRVPPLAIAVLALAALTTAGIAALAPGYLTLVSAFFFSILFGLGIDFGVHVAERVAELRAQGQPPAAALEGAVRFLAPGLGTGAATTVASFLVLGVSGFRGFAQLGLLAGAGVAVSLVAMLTVLPALLVTLPSALPPIRRQPSRAGRLLAAAQSPLLAAVLALAAVGALVGGVPKFDGDYLDLQPLDSEAVRLERAMVDGSDYATQFAAFVVADDERAAELAERLRREPTVGAVRSAADFEPLLAFGAELEEEWERFRSLYVAGDGRQAVYAFPRGDIWQPEFQEAFLVRMRAIDPEVTGMPFLGRFLVERARRALRITAALAAALLVVLVAVDLAQPWRAALALVPTALGVAAMLGGMRALGVPFNPLDMLALPIVIGVAEDSGVHLVHRFVAEGGDLGRTLAGAGRTVLICGATSLCGFGALIFADHRGLASFALSLSLGAGAALVASLLVLPQLLVACRGRLLPGTT